MSSGSSNKRSFPSSVRSNTTPSTVTRSNAKLRESPCRHFGVVVGPSSAASRTRSGCSSGTRTTHCRIRGGNHRPDSAGIAIGSSRGKTIPGIAGESPRIPGSAIGNCRLRNGGAVFQRVPSKGYTRIEYKFPHMCCQPIAKDDHIHSGQGLRRLPPCTRNRLAALS